jgi:hypothetical protein
VTPEGRVKSRVKKLLDSTSEIYYFMPVQRGLGARTLDYLGCHKGAFFAIETKAPGKKPTPLQDNTARKMWEAGARTFVIDGDIGELEEWLRR